MTDDPFVDNTFIEIPVEELLAELSGIILAADPNIEGDAGYPEVEDFS